jgi:benzoyl-CoA reductase/2-hydroxyglutaryl-CoA dehydratase subunit BcrC/BadD/HgdB
MEIPSRDEVISTIRQRGGRIAAVFPIFYPRELLRAFGLYPVEVWAPPVHGTPPPDHLQTYTCSIARNGLAFLQNSGLGRVDAVLVPHTCDTLQGLGSILLDYLETPVPVLTLYHPRGGHVFDVDFLVAELRKLADRLAEVVGTRPTDEQLMAAIRREEAADLALRKLYENRPRLPLSDREFYRLVRSREYLPAEDFVALLDQLPAPSEAIASGLKPICVSGILVDPLDLFDRLNSLGATVVCDDLACGSRRLYGPGQSSEPFRRMAERLLSTPPEPTRGQSMPARIEYLHALLREHGARGMLVYGLKFCEPELFDIPRLRTALQSAGIPLLHIEYEAGEQLSQQTQTRLEAFLEVLK